MDLFKPHCNQCYVELPRGKDVWIGINCGHMLCTSCFGKSHRYCQVCKKFTTFQNPRSSQCIPKLRLFMLDRPELLKLVSSIIKFQDIHTNNFIEHLKYENQRLKRVDKAAKLRAEYFKKQFLSKNADSLTQRQSRRICQSQSSKSSDEGFMEVPGSIKSQKSEGDGFNLGHIDYDAPFEDSVTEEVHRPSHQSRKRPPPENLSYYMGRCERKSFSQHYSSARDIGYNTALLQSRPNVFGSSDMNYFNKKRTL